MTTPNTTTPNSTETPNEGVVTQQAPAADATKVAADASKPNEGAQPNPNDAKATEGADGKADDKATDAKADDKKADAPKAPETYTDFELSKDTNVDTELMGEFKTIAKELDLTQEQAQKLAELGGKLAQKAKGPTEEAIIDAAKVKWGDETKADKELGGDKLPENLSVAKKTLDTFGTPELKDLLNKTGMGNHPEVIRLFLKIGKQISEDKVLVTGNNAATPKNHADALYGSPPKK